jgi:hypothetical protein
MSITFAQAEIGQWYTRADKGELFQVVGRDEGARTIEIQSFDGDVDEVDGEAWAALAPESAEPPEDWTAPMDDIETDDLGYSETEMTAKDWNEPLQPLRTEGESWEDTAAEEERDALGEGTPAEPLVADVPEAEERIR